MPDWAKENTMKKVNHGGTHSDTDGGKRQWAREKMMAGWLKKHRPDVFAAICEEAAKQVPYKLVRKNSQPLPASIANLK